MKITKDDWQFVLRTMDKYNRDDGFVDVIDGELIFFDSDPCHDGIHACYVTRNDVEQYIKDSDEQISVNDFPE